MPEPVAVPKARLEWIRLPDGQKESKVVDPKHTVEVQFNPESLKVTYANNVAGEDQIGGAAIQYVSKSTTKLAVDLWFDTTSDPEVVDVRDRTRRVNFFFVPIKQGKGLAPPAVRFAWGSFLFEGMMASMDETLDFFSAEGRALRAKVAITITSQFLQSLSRDLGGSSPGTRQHTIAPAGTGLQQLLGQDGSPEGWQPVARANLVENSRHLAPGALLDLDLREG